jgi:L-lactate permease
MGTGYLAAAGFLGAISSCISGSVMAGNMTFGAIQNVGHKAIQHQHMFLLFACAFQYCYILYISNVCHRYSCYSCKHMGREMLLPPEGCLTEFWCAS